MHKPSILIVEDEAIVAADLFGQLDRLGYQISGQTPRGEEAVVLARDLSPDLVLMDVRLAGPMDGVEAAQIIRRECDIPVIYLTAHSDSATLERAKLTESFGYLLKPFEELGLKTQIEMALYKHQTERKLRESEARLARAQEIAHLGSWELDFASGTLIWSDEVYRIFGLRPREFGATYEAFLEHVHPSDRRAVDKAYSSSLSDGHDSYEIKHRIVRRATGEVRWVQEKCTHIRDASGKLLRSVGMVLDITEREWAEKTLHASEAKYRSLVENSLDAIFSVDREGRFLSANPAAERLCGYSSRELQTLTFMAICAPEYLEVTVAAFLASIDGQPPGIETAVLSKDGRRVELFVTGVPVYAENDTIALFCIARDITLQKREQLERSLTLELLDLVNTSSGTRQLIKKATAFFQRSSGCDAAGIRLREGDDYPYFETRGFSPEFVALEHSLCVRDSDGCIQRDARDDAILHCICGAILRDRCNLKQYLTAHGSFWTADAPRLAETASKINIDHLRGRCPANGYQSLALIPLGRKGDRIGLLQLNSLQKHYFTADTVAFWERLAEKLSIAVAKIGAEEALKKAHEELEQRVAERTAALDRANRILSMLQKCAEAQARAGSEPELLTRICEIMLQIEGIKLAWVGFAQDDQKKTVRPVAQAGDSGGYLKNVKITWADEPRGRGPTGAAIRTHCVHVCRDVRTDERLAPWREQQLSQGFAGSIALPLIWEGQCLGALTIYSTYAEAFNEQDVELFMRLAADLTYGIVALRTRVERTHLQNELLRISECEKQTIAQELHDGLCQHFAGTALMGTLLHRRLAARSDPEADQAKRICELLNTGVHETRTLSHGLHPVKAGGEGLMEALSGLAQTVTTLFHLQCTFRCDDSVLIAEQSVATHLFRIAQEAVNNARKHGEASEVLIDLKRNREGVVLCIQDNGTGIPRGRRLSGGMGLKIMNHRAEAIGARLTICRAGEQGTVVTCALRVRM